MFKKFWLDTIFGTMFVLLFAWGVSLLFTSKIMDALDPIGDMFTDMESTDMVYAQMRKPPTAEENIIMVNIGSQSRAEIATMVHIINAYNPKVIGMDVFFRGLKEDTLADLMLADAFTQVKNLVMVSKIEQVNDEGTFDTLILSHPLFNQNSKSAFANFLTGGDNKYTQDLISCRTFTPKEIVNGNIEYALAVRLAMEMDSVKAQKFIDRNNDLEIINYKGNIIDYGSSKYGTTYFALDIPDVLNENFTLDLIEGKCVIFCYMGEYLGDRDALQDKYFTPINEKYVGKAHADMFGGVVHANILSMILNENYIDKMSDEASYFWAFLLLYINIIIFTFIYKRLPKWYDGLTKLLQLFEAILLFFLVLFAFENYNYHLNMTYAVILVIISGDMLEIYFGVVKNFFSKEGRKSLIELKKL